MNPGKWIPGLISPQSNGPFTSQAMPFAKNLLPCANEKSMIKKSIGKEESGKVSTAVGHLNNSGGGDVTSAMGSL
jgi:hypothetical protein